MKKRVPLRLLLLLLLPFPVLALDVTMAWHAPEPGEVVEQWQVVWWTDYGGGIRTKKVKTNKTTLPFADPTEVGQQMFARVQACNKEGCSPWSGLVTYTVKQADLKK